MNTKDYYDVNYVMKKYNKTRTTVLRWLKEKKLKSMYWQKQYWIHKNHVKNFKPPKSGRPWGKAKN